MNCGLYQLLLKKLTKIELAGKSAKLLIIKKTITGRFVHYYNNIISMKTNFISYIEKRW